MPIAVENLPFIDVIGLSKLHCNKPILGDLKYATHENFVGRPIAGYHPSAHDICLLAPQAAQMLCQTQNYLLNEFGYGLIIFDAYRPLRAVTDFAEWFKKAPETSYELTRKEIHYPCYEKKQLPVLGYVAEKVSRHCFGRAVDLTLVDMNTEEILNMGTGYDFFDQLSHASATAAQIGNEAFTNRHLLFAAMEKFGFHVHEKEYWHFDFHLQEINEPVDREIHPELKNHGVIRRDY